MAASIARVPDIAAYYNENDPRAASWLRELIRGGHIATGEVDERSIEDVRPADLADFTQCHFFAGIGGWSLALRMAQWSDDRPVWTGSCPCQPFSEGGRKLGFNDPRHLWPAWYRIIRECRPSVIFGEQVTKEPAWIDLVSSHLEAESYAFGAVNLGAHSASLPHVRQRYYWVAETSNRDSTRRERIWSIEREIAEFARLVPPSLHVTPSSGPYGLRDDGVPGSMGLLRGFGNAINPPVAAEFIIAYLEC